MTLLASQPHLTDTAPDRLTHGSRETVEQRSTSWRALQDLLFPTPQDEDWRRTDPRPYVGRLDLPLAESGYALPEITSLPTGIEISSLDGSKDSHDFTAMVDLPDSQHTRYFTTLWKALHDSGMVINVAPGTSIRDPLQLGITTTAPDSLHLPLTIIHVGAHASLTLALRTASPHAGTLVVGGTVIVLEDGASCTLLQSTTSASGALAAGFLHVLLGRDASFEGTLLRNGDGSSKQYLDIDLAGAGSSSLLTSLDLLNSTAHRDLQTLQLHRAPSTTSSILVRNVVDDRAHSVYSGLINVTEEAVKTDGYVQNRNLLLSREAQADSVPRLEIKANDVKCGHGTTAGHVDHEQLFYLESRGISREVAGRMIIQGFLLEGCAHMHSQEARAAAEAFVAEFAPDSSGEMQEASHE